VVREPAGSATDLSLTTMVTLSKPLYVAHYETHKLSPQLWTESQLRRAHQFSGPCLDNRSIARCDDEVQLRPEICTYSPKLHFVNPLSWF
jgi:hypothetical protein